MLLDELLRQREDVLALVVVDQVELLQGRDDVLLLDGGLLADVVNGDGRRLVVGVVGVGGGGGAVAAAGAAVLGGLLLRLLEYDGHDGVRPVGAVGEEAEVGEGLLRGAGLPFRLAQLVAELDE